MKKIIGLDAPRLSRAWRRANRERAIMQSGEMRSGSNYGKGQMVAADYGLSPEIVFSNNDAGQVGAALGGLMGGRYGSTIGALSGSLKTKEASTLPTLIDQRSGVQTAAFNQMVRFRSLRDYQAQTVQGQGLGGGGRQGKTPSLTAQPGRTAVYSEKMPSSV